MENFIETKNFKPLSSFENVDLDFKGLYALRVKDKSVLPKLFKEELIFMQSTLIYIGKGERTIYERMQEECRGKRNGTFFRGIGALLNFKPPKGSLVGKKNINNYKFCPADRDQIVDWMNENLLFNIIKIDSKSKILSEEKKLINLYCPILNATHNPKKSLTLVEKRKECRKYGLMI